jgi:aldose 1-epimerase
MRISRARIGTSAGHAEQPPTPVDAYTLDTGAGLAVTVWAYGASLVEVLVPDREGRTGNVVVRLPDLAAYESNRYMGATIGRYARCIAGASLAIDGTEYQLDRNEGRHHVHGGTLGFDRFVWSVVDAGREGDELGLTLRLDRPDGDQGYPGAVSATTVYRVTRDRRLTFEHRATTTASTVVDLTNHAAWNLAGAGVVDGHRLRIDADAVLMVDDELIPQGRPVPVAGGRLDYTTGREIASDRLDHCFALAGGTWAAELHDPRSGRTMRISTDQPGLQVYSGDGLPRPRSGICLQTGTWPNSPNRPDFPSARLDPGSVYRHVTTHDFRGAGC